MSNLFSLAQVQSEAGAKLYFYATGTSTPQNTYQDADLTTPHANPVVADADGVFDPIYLDPTLPDYRYTLTDTNGVTLFGPIDDVAASGSQSTAYRVKGTAPEIIFEETDASSNNKKWRVRAQAEVLTISAGNDAESSWTDRVAVDRDGVVAVGYKSAASTALLSGSFTGTLTGFTTTPTTDVHWTKFGPIVVLTIVGQSATSNATSFTITGLPSALQPTTMSAAVSLPPCYNNGSLVTNASASISAGSGTITLAMDSSAFGWTNSGTKGLSTSTLVYSVV